MNMTTLRAGLPPVPPRMRSLPLNEKGYPVPWFVEWIDGVPDFRVMDSHKFKLAIRFGHCWLCGQPLGKFKTFVIGPMCAVNRTSSEPPSHHDCATFAALGCPFLTLPKAKRREANLPEHNPPAGVMLARNPGATCLWTSTYRAFRANGTGGSRPGVLLELHEPTSVEWFAQGAPCGRAPVQQSIDSGMHHLWGMAKREGIDALVQLENFYARAMTLLPAA